MCVGVVALVADCSRLCVGLMSAGWLCSIVLSVAKCSGCEKLLGGAVRGECWRMCVGVVAHVADCSRLCVGWMSAGWWCWSGNVVTCSRFGWCGSLMVCRSCWNGSLMIETCR